MQCYEPVDVDEYLRPDLGGRIVVDRQPSAFDFHRHHTGVALALDRRYLADIDPRDPHGRLGVDVQGRAELRLQLEAVFERDPLGEAEVDADGQHQDQEHGKGDAAATP